MSSTADVADAATSVQQMLTAAEHVIRTEGGELPIWYIGLREQIHSLVTSAAWAVGEKSGATLVGYRCEGRTHSDECIAYREAVTTFWDEGLLIACPRCKASMHSLFEAGPQPYNCYPCWKETHA